MTDRKYSPLFKLGGVALGLGVALVALGSAYGSGCDFDTMNVCRPLGLWTGDSFLVSATAGLFLLAGLGLGALGGLLILVGLWRRRPGNTRSRA